MSGAVSAAEANRRFSKLLGQVKGGRSVTITSHGQPVAKMIPIQAGQGVRTAARATLVRRLRASRVQHVGRWTRDELYEPSR